MAIQPRLFDPGPEYEGPLSTRQFMEQAQWHSTEVDQWSDRIRRAGVPVHSGTAAAANDTEPFGNRYPVRPLNVQEDRLHDAEANMLDKLYRKERGLGVTDKIDESAAEGFLPKTRLDEFSNAASFAYENQSEDPGSTSFVSHPRGFQTIRDTKEYQSGEFRPREYLTPSEASQQGMPVGEQRETRVKSDPRLIESLRTGSGRDKSAEYLRGEDFHALPETFLNKMGGRVQGDLPRHIQNNPEVKNLPRIGRNWVDF